ncbi:MAG: hypothetical protein EA406_03740 [Rhodospirillales bacterium]|nr:MAG: hypothetical protein EA406_03740 [Rhodospirillales bacterium]
MMVWGRLDPSRLAEVFRHLAHARWRRRAGRSDGSPAGSDAGADEPLRDGETPPAQGFEPR